MRSQTICLPDGSEWTTHYWDHPTGTMPAHLVKRTPPNSDGVDFNADAPPAQSWDPPPGMWHTDYNGVDR